MEAEALFITKFNKKPHGAGAIAYERVLVRQEHGSGFDLRYWGHGGSSCPVFVRFLPVFERLSFSETQKLTAQSMQP